MIYVHEDQEQVPLIGPFRWTRWNGIGWLTSGGEGIPLDESFCFCFFLLFNQVYLHLYQGFLVILGKWNNLSIALNKERAR